MTAVLSKWGNSFAVRIPASIAQKSKLQLGDKLDINVSRHGRITLVPIVEPAEPVLPSIPTASAKPTIDFGALYAKITPDNRYESVDLGAEVGGETVTW